MRWIYGVSYFFVSESEMVPITDEEYNEEEIKDNVPDNEKNDHHFKDTKQCKSLKWIAIHI